MQRYVKIIITLSSLLFLVALMIINPRGGSGEDTTEYVNNRIEYSELIFSREPGFYNDPFTLYIEGPTDDIYYTLDGSEPDESSRKYDKHIGIQIIDATENPNVYSVRTDTSVAFLEDVLTEYGYTGPGYKVPDYNVDKCTVVRAICKRQDGKMTAVKTGSFFVGFQDKEGYDGMNVLSVVSDPDNFFNYDTGIYVLGRTFYEECTFKRSYIWWEANYWGSGMEWERPCTVQFFNAEGSLLLKEDCGVRIQGRGSRAYLPRGLKFYAREEYSGNNRLYADLFNTGYIPKRVKLTGGGNAYKDKIKEAFLEELCSGFDVVTTHQIPYQMFLDGEYWGMYFLTEKYDKEFFSYYFNVNKDNVIYSKRYKVKEGKDSDQDLINELVNTIYRSDMSLEENYVKANELIDMDSYLQYMALEIYLANLDWPRNNVGLWRTREVEDEEYGDGRWRYVIFDLDLAAGYNGTLEYDTIAKALEVSDMFNSFMENDSFRASLVNTIMDAANTSLSAEYATSLLDEYIERYSEAADLNYKRFYESTTISLDSRNAKMREFFQNRLPYVLEDIEEHFEESGVSTNITVELSDTAGGTVKVNSVYPEFDEDGRWSGTYFTGYPVTLTAEAADGYEFIGWEGLSDASDSVVSISIPEEGGTVRAVFEKKK